MDKITEIVKSEIIKLINESVGSDNLYHFTPFFSLKEIMRSNTFLCSPSGAGSDAGSATRMTKKYNSSKYKYYISCSRNKDPEQGYAHDTSSANIRIEFDSNALRTLRNSKIIPFSFYYNPKQYTDQIGTKYFGTDNMSNMLSMIENEDRILMVDSFIPNAFNYIKRIDIFLAQPIINKFINTDEFAKLSPEILQKIYLYQNYTNYRFQLNKGVINLYSYILFLQDERYNK